MKPAKNISPLNFTTRFRSCCFSFALSRFFNNSGFLIIMTIPAMNIGTNRIPINNRPLNNKKVPAGKNNNTPTQTTPNKKLAVA